MSAEETHDFTGYEPTTVDPGWTATIAMIILCTLANLSLPLLVRLADWWDRQKEKKKADSDLAEEQAGTKHREQLSDVMKQKHHNGSPTKVASPLSIYQLATKTSSDAGSAYIARSAVSEGVRSTFSVKSSVSSTVLSQAASAILDQRISRLPKKRRRHRVDINLSPHRRAAAPRTPDDDDDDDDASACSKSVMSVLDHDAVSVRDAVDAQEGQVLGGAGAPKLLEHDEPSTLWQQFLEIADWDAESKRLTVLTIPYTIQGCTESLFQTINVAVIGHFLGVMQANAFVVVTILLEFSQTATYGFGEAIGTIVPHAEGAGNNLLAGRYLQLAIILYTITSIPSVVLWSMCTYQAVIWFGFDEETATISQQFAYPFLLHVFLSGLDHAIHEFLNVTGHEKYSTVVRILYHGSQTLSVVVVVSLGVKDLYIVGLVLSSLGLFMSISNVIFVVHCGWMNDYWEGLAQTLSLRDVRAFRTVLVTAIPMSIAWLLTYGEWELLTIFASAMGPAEVAAWGILGFVWDIFERLTAGFADAAECRVGFRMGAGQPHCAKIAAYKSVYMGIVVAVFATGGLFIISAYLPGWMTPDPTLQRMIFECLPLIGFGQIMMIAGNITWGSVGAQGRIRVATTVEFVSSWFIAIPLSALSLYVFNLNILGFVAALIVGYTVGGVAMGFVLLRSDWNALSQAVIARNAIEGFSWEDNEWEELPPHVQTAALRLGYSREMWNNGEEPPSNDRDWDDLNPEEKEAARIIGFNKNTWDNERDTSDGESNSDGKGRYDDLSWNNLPPHAQEAAKKLGYTKKIWDADEEPASTDREWNALSSAEKEAAMTLGYDKEKWDGGCQPVDNKSKVKEGKETSAEKEWNGGSDVVKAVSANIIAKGGSLLDSNKGIVPPLEYIDNMAWKDLPVDIKVAAETLGYNSEIWDNDLSAPIEQKCWNKLTEEEKQAVRKLGYNKDTWDDDDSSSSNSSTDADDKLETSREVYLETAWHDLPKEMQLAAKILGYNSVMWDNDESPPSDDKWWHKLTDEEQKAARILGYDEKTWNEDSSSSSQETD